MKPREFEYVRAHSVEHALTLLAEEDDVKVLAGGQSLIPTLNMRLSAPKRLVDINDVAEMQGIELQDGYLYVGALTRHAELQQSQLVATHVPLLATAIAHVAHAAIRNRGTIGGSVAHADPAADWPTALLALGGEVKVVGSGGEKSIPLDGFQVGPFTTGLGWDEVLIGFDLPALGPNTKWGYYKVNRKPGEFADAIGAVIIGNEARAVCGATESAPFRVFDIEEKLSGGATELSVADAREILSGHDAGFDDYELQIHAVALSRAIGRAFA